MVEVFPPSNLPGEAQDWGRSVESRIEGLEWSSEVFQSQTENDFRFNGGQLAVAAAQLEEQVERRTLQTSVPDIPVTGNATAEPFPRASRTFSLQAPQGKRVARVEVYGDTVQSGDAAVDAYLSYQNEIISRIVWRFSTDSVVSVSETNFTGSGMAFVTLPNSGLAEFTLTVVRVGFTSTPSTVAFRNIRTYLTPFQATA